MSNYQKQNGGGEVRCINCRKTVFNDDIGREKTFVGGDLSVGFFILCKKCVKNLDKETADRLEREYWEELTK